MTERQWVIDDICDEMMIWLEDNLEAFREKPVEINIEGLVSLIKGALERISQLGILEYHPRLEELSEEDFQKAIRNPSYWVTKLDSGEKL